MIYPLTISMQGREHDRVTADTHRFEVVEMDGRRVHRVLVTPNKAKGRR